MSKIAEKFKLNPNDTGSVEVQVVNMTERINHLTEHLKNNKKDYSTQRGLMRLVGMRRSFLDYLKDNKRQVYEKLIQELDLRK
jgi:small subunit ribosomal protein S15